jgi:hypothetical protein
VIVNAVDFAVTGEPRRTAIQAAFDELRASIKGNADRSRMPRRRPLASGIQHRIETR